MHKLKVLFDFYLNASIHVAFAVFSFYRISCLMFNIPDTKNLDFVIFLSTIIMYNFIKYGSRAKKYFFVKVRYEKIIQIFSFFTGVILLINLFKLPLLTLILLALLGLLSVFYILPFIGNGINLRSLSAFKVYTVAFVWAITTVIIPFSNHWELVTIDVWLSLFQRFLMVIVLILPFEIRDMQSDTLDLQTIPRKIGIRTTKILGYLLLGLLILIEFFKTKFAVAGLATHVFFLIITGLALRFAKTNQSVYYTRFWIESIPVFLWGAAVLFFRFL